MDYLFTDWVEIYLNNFAKRRLKSSTFESYKHYAKHINIYKRLSELSALDLQIVINEMSDSGFKTSTVKHTATVMRRSILKAEQLGLCNRALWYGIELPPDDTLTAEAFNETDFDKIKNDCFKQNSIYSDCFLFLANTGLRVGELIALKRFSDFDNKNKTIAVNGTAFRGTIYPPKTKNSLRTIPLNKVAYDIILRQNHNSEFIFTNSFNEMISYRSLLESWKFTLKRCGISHCGLHRLRHTFATNLLKNGADIKTIQLLLGHSSSTITMNYYLHPDIKQLRNAVNLL